MTEEVYQPMEDSFLLSGFVSKKCRGKKVLDMGTGSGIQARAWASRAYRVGI